MAVKGNRVYVAGAATFGTTGKGPSAVHAFDTKTGELVADYPTAGENLRRARQLLDRIRRERPAVRAEHPARRPPPHARDGGARALRQALPRPQALRAPARRLRAHPPSPTPRRFPTTSPSTREATRTSPIRCRRRSGGCPPGLCLPAPKTPQIWFQDSRLASPYIGVNGLRLNPARTLAFITVITDLLGQSFVYTLPLSAKPGAGDLKVFHQCGAGAIPDGIAFGRSGLLYVAIATPGASGVSILSPAARRWLGSRTRS